MSVTFENLIEAKAYIKTNPKVKYATVSYAWVSACTKEDLLWLIKICKQCDASTEQSTKMKDQLALYRDGPYSNSLPTKNILMAPARMCEILKRVGAIQGVVYQWKQIFDKIAPLVRSCRQDLDRILPRLPDMHFSKMVFMSGLWSDNRNYGWERLQLCLVLMMKVEAIVGSPGDTKVLETRKTFSEWLVSNKAYNELVTKLRFDYQIVSNSARMMADINGGYTTLSIGTVASGAFPPDHRILLRQAFDIRTEGKNIGPARARECKRMLIDPIMVAFGDEPLEGNGIDLIRNVPKYDEYRRRLGVFCSVIRTIWTSGNVQVVKDTEAKARKRNFMSTGDYFIVDLLKDPKPPMKIGDMIE